METTVQNSIVVPIYRNVGIPLSVHMKMERTILKIIYMRHRLQSNAQFFEMLAYIHLIKIRLLFYKYIRVLCIVAV